VVLLFAVDSSKEKLHRVVGQRREEISGTPEFRSFSSTLNALFNFRGLPHDPTDDMPIWSEGGEKVTRSAAPN